jgi:hypothetical protein
MRAQHAPFGAVQMIKGVSAFATLGVGVAMGLEEPTLNAAFVVLVKAAGVMIASHGACAASRWP